MSTLPTNTKAVEQAQKNYKLQEIIRSEVFHATGKRISKSQAAAILELLRCAAE